MEKGVALLSGGIDSPVAINLMQDRLDIVAVHFHQLPLTDEKEIEKVKNLCLRLYVKTLYLVPFTPVLKKLVECCNHKDYYVLQKITMLRTAQILAQRLGAVYLITGENLAQVSSQTLSNLTSITKHVEMTILRPVLTYNKQEIIDHAKRINTFDISKGPEICSLLGPKMPSTRSDPKEIGKELEKLDLGILQNALNNAQIITF